MWPPEALEFLRELRLKRELEAARSPVAWRAEFVGPSHRPAA
jgi:hypothetical protein